MKPITSRLLPLAFAAVGLASSNGASAGEELREINGYNVDVIYYYDPPTEDELHTYFLLITDAQGNLVPAADLGDPNKTRLKAELLYFGTKDTPDNYTAKPLVQKAIGDVKPYLSFDGITGNDGFMLTEMIRETRPGAYGLRLTGLLNGAAVDEKFVCGKASQDPNASLACVGRVPVFPGTLQDRYIPNTEEPWTTTPPGEHQVSRAPASGDAPDSDAMQTLVENQLKAVRQKLNPVSKILPDRVPRL
ncbi:MAG: hypothetical protein U1E83_00535 [Methylotetracoccus sp.]